MANSPAEIRVVRAHPVGGNLMHWGASLTKLGLGSAQLSSAPRNLKLAVSVLLLRYNSLNPTFIVASLAYPIRMCPSVRNLLKSSSLRCSRSVVRYLRSSQMLVDVCYFSRCWLVSLT